MKHVMFHPTSHKLSWFQYIRGGNGVIAIVLWSVGHYSNSCPCWTDCATRLCRTMRYLSCHPSSVSHSSQASSYPLQIQITNCFSDGTVPGMVFSTNSFIVSFHFFDPFRVEFFFDIMNTFVLPSLSMYKGDE